MICFVWRVLGFTCHLWLALWSKMLINFNISWRMCCYSTNLNSSNIQRIPSISLTFQYRATETLLRSELSVTPGSGVYHNTYYHCRHFYFPVIQVISWITELIRCLHRDYVYLMWEKNKRIYKQNPQTSFIWSAASYRIERLRSVTTS